jgi:heat shock protein HslJ
MAILASSCVSGTQFSGSANPEHLRGDLWHLEQFSDSTGRVSRATARLTVEFAAGGRVGGAAGPNGYGGYYSATSQGTLRISDVVTTLIGGPEADQAGAYLYHLTHARSFEASERDLRIWYSDRGFLHFRRTPSSRATAWDLRLPFAPGNDADSGAASPMLTWGLVEVSSERT